MSCLYILEIKPLSVASFANIFSHFVGCLFVLLMVSYAVQKILSLIRSNLFIFGFIFITLGGANAFFFWLHWVFVAACRLSLAAVSGGYSLLQYVSFPSWCLLFSCFRARALGTQASVTVACGLSSCGSRAQ